MTPSSSVPPAKPALDLVDFQVTKAKVRAALLHRASAPTFIGRYEVVGRAGAGAMGRVVIGVDAQLQRRVAIKLVAPQVVDRDSVASLHQRLVREARALARLSDPNVVEVYEVGLSGTDVFVVMEYVPGRSLREWMSPPRPWREVVDVFVQAGRGVAAAHARGIVHRDLKPDNVLVGDDGRVRVADFGLARAAQEVEVDLASSPSWSGPDTPDAGRTVTGARVGTPAYRAPELDAGADASAASDQFALSVTMYEALFGHRPSAGRAREVRIPGWLDAVVRRGMAPRPARRFSSVDAWVAALRRGPRRRRFVAVAGATAVAGIGLTVPRPAVGDDCDAIGDALDEVYDEVTRQALREAFAGSPAAHVRRLGPPMVAQLDDFAGSWKTARTRACDAARGRDDTAPIACLQRQRVELSATLERVLADPADPHVPELVAGLPSPERCRDAEHVPPPDDPAEVASIEEALVRARVDARAGAHQEAVDRVTPLLSRARALDDDRLVAHVQTVRGRNLARLDADEAPAVLREAIWLAETWRADEVAAEAWLHLLAWHVAHGETEPLPTTLARAQAAVDRLGATAGVHRGRLHALAGRAATAAGDLETATRELQVADELYAELGETSGAGRADVLDALAAVYFQRGDYPEAVRTFERGIAIGERVYGPDHPLLAERLQNLATALVATGEPARALRTFERAAAVTEASEGSDGSNLIHIHNGWGAAWEGIGEAGRALEHYERALHIAERRFGAEHSMSISPLTNIGRIHRQLGDDDRAREALERALALAEAKYGPTHVRLADPLTSLGQLAMARDDPRAAIDYHRRAWQLRRESAGPDALVTAICAHNLGDALRAAGHPEQAREHLLAARDVFASLPEDHAYRRASAEAFAKLDAAPPR